MQSPEEKTQIMREKRDAKVRDHLSQYAPVWLVDEVVILDEDALQFNVVFYHPNYKWVSRRYRYDSFNDVLYHKGQVLLDEADTVDLQNQDPYLYAPVINTVNSYGG
jgi:hypothetical protein